MKQIHSLDTIPNDQDMLAGIDITGNLKKLFSTSVQMPGCLFLLCTRGNCTATIHLSQYQIQKGCTAIVFPNQFFQITEQSADCRFIFIAFTEKLVQSPNLFSKVIEYAPSIFEDPVICLNEKITRIFHDYLMVVIRASRDMKLMFNPEHVQLLYTQLIIGLGGTYKQDESCNRKACYNRNQEIVKDLMRMVVKHYHTERNISFYAEKMHLSPQHLSTTIKKTTGKTLTNIISSFVIRDAQGKLRSTELSIQEIAYSLNFPDISFFGKYFKRYTGVSPKKYRKMG